MLKYLFFLALACCSHTSLQAQITKDLPIRIKKFDINVEAGAFMATTTIRLELFNPNPKVMDGSFEFSLDEGQVITGFALDINGKLREGVIVDKKQGRVAYENTIRRRIDPGLLEMIAGDQYRVRVYPMPANGTRKLEIIVSQVLQANERMLSYFLPLQVAEPVEQFAATVKVKASQANQQLQAVC